MRIAHISDLHISTEHRRRHIRDTRRMLEAIQGLGVDHVVVTGDLTADATRSDLRLARAIFSSFGLLDARRLTVVPGNHDIFGGVHHAEELLTFPARCRKTPYASRLAHFTEAFHETFEGTVTAGEGPYPFLKRLGGVSFFGVNSVADYSRVKNPLGSNGDVGDPAPLRRLLDAPAVTGTKKIVLLHHHFNRPESDTGGTLSTVWGAIERQTLKLRGKKQLITLFGDADVSLVLHGHFHEHRAYERGGIRFSNAGGCILGTPGQGAMVPVLSMRGGDIVCTMHPVSAEPRGPRSVVSLRASSLAIPSFVRPTAA